MRNLFLRRMYSGASAVGRWLALAPSQIVQTRQEMH